MNITLDIFEGPFDFLIYLIQKKEIEAAAVSLQKIIQQYQHSQDCSLDEGAEFIGTAASLMLLKSKFLLPLNDSIEVSEEMQDLKFDLIHQLVDYCRFKQAAKELSRLEYQQSGLYARGQDYSLDPQKTLGIEHLSLEDLASLFQQVLARVKQPQGLVCDEDWKVSDKIAFLREVLKTENEIEFTSLFVEEMNKLEIIVLFLAILELMKSGEMSIIKDNKTDLYKVIKK